MTTVKMYRYYVELKGRCTLDEQFIPHSFLFDEQWIPIGRIERKDKGYSPHGDFCDRYHFKSNNQPYTLYRNRYNRWYIELPIFRPDLMDSFDRANYLPKGDDWVC